MSRTIWLVALIGSALTGCGDDGDATSGTGAGATGGTGGTTTQGGSGGTGGAAGGATQPGDVLWASRFANGPYPAYVRDIALDEDGSLLMVGTATTELNLGGSNEADVGNGGFLARLDDDGELVMARQLCDDDRTLQVALLPSGDIVTASSFDFTCDLDGNAYVADDRDVMIARFGADGSYGWSKAFSAPARQYAHGLAVLPDGSLVLSGSFNQAIDFGGTPHVATTQDPYVARFDGAGNLIWSHAFACDTCSFGTAIGRVRVAAADGVVVVAGDYGEGVIDIAGTVLPAMGPSESALWVAAFDADGALIWSASSGPLDLVAVRGVDIGDDGTIHVNGRFTGTLTVGSVSTSGDGSEFLLRMSASGDAVDFFKGGFHAVAVAPDGAMVLAAGTRVAALSSDFTELWTSTSDPSEATARFELVDQRAGRVAAAGLAETSTSGSIGIYVAYLAW